MNFEEKIVKLPIGKIIIKEFDSVIRIQDFSMIGLLFFILIFGGTGFLFYDSREHLHKVDLHPIPLIAGCLGLLFTLKEIFLSSNFSSTIRFNEIKSISFEEHRAVHVLPMTMLVFNLFSGKKRSVWIKKNDQKELETYFNSKFISVK